MTLCVRPGVPGPGVRAVRGRGRRRATTSRSSTTACRWAAPPGSTDGRLSALRQTRADRGPDRSARHAGDRQPGPRGRRRHRGPRRPRGRHRARPAADLSVVHPRGRPADAPAHRPDPRRRLPRRERRDHRCRQQLPVQREPGRPAAAVHATRRPPSRRSAASGATTTSPAPRCPPCASPTSTCRASRRRADPGSANMRRLVPNRTLLGPGRAVGDQTAGVSDPPRYVGVRRQRRTIRNREDTPRAW